MTTEKVKIGNHHSTPTLVVLFYSEGRKGMPKPIKPVIDCRELGAFIKNVVEYCDLKTNYNKSELDMLRILYL